MEENNILLDAIFNDASMAIYSLNALLDSLKDKDNKINGTVRNIIKGYERYLKDCNKLIKNYKVVVKENGFMKKMGAKMGVKEEVKNDNSDARIADMLIKGIAMGSLDIEKKMKNCDGKACKDVKSFAKDFYQFQQDNITCLKDFL